MKKFLLILATIFTLFGCERQLNVEKTISADREYMAVNYEDNYRWFESCILLDNYLDADTVITVSGISNVFQVVTPNEGSYDTKVILLSHTKKNDSVEVKEHAFWVGDQPLNNEEIVLSFDDALKRVFEANLPKPHSRQCVLRKELGPKPGVNPQYVFGNVSAQIYVDAVTGVVADKNPAYDEDLILSW